MLKKIVNTALKIIACYLLAGVGYLLYFGWPDYEGHAHVPFSDFPAFLLWSPVAPAIILGEFMTKSWGAFPGALVFIAALAASLWFTFRKRPARKKPSAGGFAWALLFLSSGRMPPPPPPSQIEQEAGERKNREIGRGKES
jgi:hypothetical protein